AATLSVVPGAGTVAGTSQITITGLQEGGTLNHSVSSLPLALGPLPSPWTDGNLGGAIGLSSYASASQTLTVQGSGPFIGTSDYLQFANQPLNGDGTIVAHIVSMQNTWADTATFVSKAGVMIRELQTSGGGMAFAGIQANAGAAFQYAGQSSATIG